MSDYNSFIKEIKKVNNNRKHKVTNSYGSKDAFKYYRKIKPNDSKFVLTDCQYLQIIRLVNDQLRLNLINGEDVLLPERMGRLELRKTSARIKFENGKIKTNLPIDWNATLKLWYDNPFSKSKKQLVRQENKETFRVFYNRAKANYNNKSFYEFNTNRDLKLGLKKNIKLNKIDAFSYGK
jgi:hypothetical protein